MLEYGELSEVPYREKTAWLSLIAMAVTFGPYFAIVAANPVRSGEVPDLRQLGLFAIATIVQMLILGAGHLYLKKTSPRDAGMPPDERDRAIMRRSIEPCVLRSDRRNDRRWLRYAF